MNWNIFNKDSSLFQLRWIIIVAVFFNFLLAYANLTGWRFFSDNTKQQWAATGPGYHK